MGSRVTLVVGFLPANFQLPVLFHFRFRVTHRTNRETTAISALCTHLVGAGIITTEVSILNMQQWLITLNIHLMQINSQKSTTAIISTNVTITATHLKTTSRHTVLYELSIQNDNTWTV